MATIRPVLRKDRKNSKGFCPIAICVTIARKRIYHNIGIWIPEKAWNGSEIKGNYPNADVLNLKVATKITDVQREIVQKEIKKDKITFNAVRSLMKDDTGRGDFHAYALKYLSEIENPGTRRRYDVEYEHLKKYRPVLQFGDIDQVFLNKYRKQRLKEVEHNTMINSFKYIRRIFNDAKSMGKTTLYPFKGWDFPKYIPKIKPYLSLDEIDRIWALLDKTRDETLKGVIVFFCLECYSGLRYSDWKKYSIEKRINGNNLFIRSTKTGVPVLLPLDLMPSLSKVVDYIKTHDVKNEITGEHTNRILKSIALSTDIYINVTTHLGRHTCATMWLEKGMTREGVAALIGVSLKTVDTYAKFTTNKLRSEINRIGGI